jgi:prepilin-type N-terminal cleavage/methylation domain-containing protein/prepilin-type processing-associated H-X9-DG protein
MVFNPTEAKVKRVVAGLDRLKGKTYKKVLQGPIKCAIFCFQTSVNQDYALRVKHGNANRVRNSAKEWRRAVTQAVSRIGAFTLIELLVVISIISILAALMLPVLAKAKQQAHGIKCIGNLRQLAVAWAAYGTESKDYFAINGGADYQPPGDETGPSVGANSQWCPGQMGQDAPVMGEQTNTAWLAAGVIYPYVNNPNVYFCPADVSSFSGGMVYPGGVGGTARVRSVSMNAWLNPPDVEIEDYEMSGTFRIYTKLADVAVPGPANLWLMMDENPYSIDVAFNLNYPNGSGWIDCPASYHNGSCAISFCDGHAEIKKWTDPVVLRWQSNSSPLTPVGTPTADFIWLAQRTTTAL